MDLGWGNQKAKNFVTTVGLVSSDGPNGPDIMAAEWTYYVSHSPGLVSVHIRKAGKASAENILSSKEFAISIVSEDQTHISSIAGGSAGKQVDKVGMLREYGVEFLPGKMTKTLLVEGAAMHIECKLRDVVEVGSHTMFVGEVVEIESFDRTPVVYHNNKYWKLGEHISKPPHDELERIAKLKEKHTRK